MKTCYLCGEEKPLEDFGRHRIRFDGLNRVCKECWKSYTRLHYAARKHYPALFEKQGGVCYVCHRPETARDRNGKVQRLATDIDYENGWICGLACRTCNIAIEIFRTNPAMLLAFQYALERNRYDINQPRIAA